MDPGSVDTALPLGRPPAGQLVRAALSIRSNQLPVVVRVGIAALVSGTIASALGVQHAYWAIVAAVLILHQGLDWTRMVQRSLGRVLGTLAGLLLAGLILAAYPQGLWLEVTVALLQFIIESVVGTGSLPPGHPPAFVSAELTALRDALEQDTAH